MPFPFYTCGKWVSERPKNWALVTELVSDGVRI